MAHELLDGGQGDALLVKEVREGGAEPVIGDVLGQSNRLGGPLDVSSGEVVASGPPLLPGADQAQGTFLLAHATEPGQHQLRDRHHGGVAVLGLVGNEDLLVGTIPGPRHHAGLVVPHAHQELGADEERGMEASESVHGLQEAFQGVRGDDRPSLLLDRHCRDARPLLDPVLVHGEAEHSPQVQGEGVGPPPRMVLKVAVQDRVDGGRVDLGDLEPPDQGKDVVADQVVEGADVVLRELGGSLLHPGLEALPKGPDRRALDANTFEAELALQGVDEGPGLALPVASLWSPRGCARGKRSGRGRRRSQDASPSSGRSGPFHPPHDASCGPPSPALGVRTPGQLSYRAE